MIGLPPLSGDSLISHAADPAPIQPTLEDLIGKLRTDLNALSIEVASLELKVQSVQDSTNNSSITDLIEKLDAAGILREHPIEAVTPGLQQE